MGSFPYTVGLNVVHGAMYSDNLQDFRTSRFSRSSKFWFLPSRPRTVFGGLSMLAACGCLERRSPELFEMVGICLILGLIV